MNSHPGPALWPDERAALVERRIQDVRDLLERHGGDGLLLDSRRDFAWLTHGGLNHILYTTETGVAPILVTRDDAVVLAPVNEFQRIADEEVFGLPLRVVATPWWEPKAHIEQATAMLDGGLLLTAGQIADDLQALRSVLDGHEHEHMEWLAGRVLDIVGAALAEVEPGTAEHEIVARVAGAFAREGILLPVVLIAGDDRIVRYRHPLAAFNRIEGRVMLVVVGESRGLHVAHTQFRELRERGSEIEERAAKLAEVMSAMRAATVPGNTLGDVLLAAQSAYARVEMPDEWRFHHQGGTIGYQARERIATPGDQTPIRPGMAFAWNPSAVGFKREETFYLDGAGAQHVLTTTPD